MVTATNVTMIKVSADTHYVDLLGKTIYEFDIETYFYEIGIHGSSCMIIMNEDDALKVLKSVAITIHEAKTGDMNVTA